ncbi:MAG TPA: proton-conducting transporter membrane subunit [Bacteroidales bacterium]|nr:proton-conducting transporter membrane subunit [Bacteroidales bacterium]HPS16772.1 proton-conducting transporter membrane subunit [Bacteroidales bacterium]
MELIIYFIAVFCITAFVFFVRKKTAQYIATTMFCLVQLTFNYLLIIRKDLFLETYFHADALSIIFVSVLSITGITTIINGFVYLNNHHDNFFRRGIFFASLFMLFACMTGAFLSDNINLLWILAEATTLCISMLIYHDRNEATLEATWKYFFVSTIGLSLSFIGILLLNAATNLSGFSSLTFSSLMSEQILITNQFLFQVSFLLIVIGFSVKMEVFPLHTVCIDALSVAPGPVSAIISTSLMNVGFVSVFRFYQLFVHTSLYNWMSHVMLIIGVLSLLVATVYMLKVDNYKRLIAYSSIEHMGLIAIGIGVGGMAYFAVILHLIIHSFTKAGLFYQTSQFVRIFKTKHIEGTGGYFGISPSGGVLMLFLFLVIMGIPPSGIFFTKLMIFQSLIANGYLWLLIIILLLLVFILWAFGKNIFHILFLKEPQTVKESKTKISFWENIPQYFLLVLGLYIGLNPPEALKNMINEAIQYLIK